LSLSYSTGSSNHSRSPQKLYERAAKAELARDLDTAFRLYVQAASAFLNLSRVPAHPQIQEQARKDADRALERAERIKAVKQDLAPVLRNPHAPGSSLRRFFLVRKLGHR